MRRNHGFTYVVNPIDGADLSYFGLSFLHYGMLNSCNNLRTDTDGGQKVMQDRSSLIRAGVPFCRPLLPMTQYKPAEASSHYRVIKKAPKANQALPPAFWSAVITGFHKTGSSSCVTIVPELGFFSNHIITPDEQFSSNGDRGLLCTVFADLLCEPSVIASDFIIIPDSHPCSLLENPSDVSRALLGDFSVTDFSCGLEDSWGKPCVVDQFVVMVEPHKISDFSDKGCGAYQAYSRNSHEQTGGIAPVFMSDNQVFDNKFQVLNLVLVENNGVDELSQQHDLMSREFSGVTFEPCVGIAGIDVLWSDEVVLEQDFSETALVSGKFLTARCLERVISRSCLSSRSGTKHLSRWSWSNLPSYRSVASQVASLNRSLACFRPGCELQQHWRESFFRQLERANPKPVIESDSLDDNVKRLVDTGEEISDFIFGFGGELDFDDSFSGGVKADD
jgi:hypothetical protein